MKNRLAAVFHILYKNVLEFMQNAASQRPELVAQAKVLIWQ